MDWGWVVAVFLAVGYYISIAAVVTVVDATVIDATDDFHPNNQ